jgi:hypothetical protein
VPISEEQILAELEDVIRAAPTPQELRQGTPDTHAWLGRALAAVELWNGAKGIAAGAALMKIQAARTPMDLGQGYSALMVLLHQGRHTLRALTLGPVSVAVGHGSVFDYFDGLRKEIQTAQQDLFFVDAYLDADFVSTYLPHVKANVSIRLLGRQYVTTLVPAAKLFRQQSNHQVEVRSSGGFHNRFVIIDRTRCLQSGTSFKDGARTSPTEITEITDAAAAVKQTYEAIWQNAKVELPP